MDDDEEQYQLYAASGDLLKDLKGSDGIDRIRALLSEWLRIENMVVLLGAGCSISRGGVALAGLQDHVLDTVLDLGTDLAELGETVDLVRARQQESADGAADFESWLSSIATAQHTLSASGSLFKSVVATLGSEETGRDAPTPSSPDRIRLDAKALSSLLTTISKVIVSRCSLTLPPLPTSGPSGHHALVAKLVARDPTLGRAHVFTTNYDLLMESAADDLRVRYSTGFIGSVEPKFDSSAYTLDLYYPGEVAEGRVQRFDKFFHLYKLHGSIDWRRKSRSELIRTDSRSLPNWPDWRSWDRGDRLRFLRGDSGDSQEAVAILPTESKYLQSIGMPYAHLFRALDAHLKAPQTFFLVIGYGFGDEHINRIIDEALTNPGLVVLIVDPNPPPQLSERLERYQASGERAFLLTATNPPAEAGLPELATFDDFAVNLMPHVRWLDDFLRLRKVEKLVREEPRPTDSGEGDDG